MFNYSIGNFDEAIKLFTEAIFKNPSASMYAKRARYLTDIFVFNSVVVVCSVTDKFSLLTALHVQVFKCQACPYQHWFSNQ